MSTSQSYIAVIQRNDFSHEVTRAFDTPAEAEAEANRRIEALRSECYLDNLIPRFHYRVHALPVVPEMAQTDRFIAAVKRARRIATDAGHRSVGTQHLLLAVLDPESLATQALACMGIFIKWTDLHAHVMSITNPNA